MHVIVIHNENDTNTVAVVADLKNLDNAKGFTEIHKNVDNPYLMDKPELEEDINTIFQGVMLAMGFGQEAPIDENANSPDQQDV